MLAGEPRECSYIYRKQEKKKGGERRIFPVHSSFFPIFFFVLCEKGRGSIQKKRDSSVSISQQKQMKKRNEKNVGVSISIRSALIDYELLIAKKKKKHTKKYLKDA